MSIIQEDEIKELGKELYSLHNQLEKMKRKIKLTRQKIYDAEVILRFKKLEVRD